MIIVLALLFFPFLKPLARLLTGLLPVRVDVADPSQPVYLDGAARETEEYARLLHRGSRGSMYTRKAHAARPTIALAGAAREALRMVDVFEDMLRGAIASFDRDDRKRVSETKRMEDVLNRLDRAMKGCPAF